MFSVKVSCHKVGTHHNPSDVLTKFAQASVLGQHLPKLNLFKDHSLSQVFKFCAGVEKLKAVHRSHRAIKEAHCTDQRLARLYHQVCDQHQGQVCMINFEAFQDHQDFMIQRFKSASSKIRRAFTPPPRRGSDESNHSDHSDVQIQLPEVDQNIRNGFIQNVSATRRWWSFVAIIMYLTHFIVQCYQLINVMTKKVRLRQIIGLLANVTQVWTMIMTIMDQRRRQVQRRNQSRQSRLSDIHQYLCAFVLFSVLFAICVFIVIRFMSLNLSSSQSPCLTAVSNSPESARSQVLRQLSTSLSTSVATFISRMAAAQQTSASAASVAKSIQSMTVAHVKHEELNNDVQTQVVRHALSAAESTQKIMSSKVSWSSSLSTPSTQGISICSRLSSSLKWQISLNKGTTTQQTSGTSLSRSSSFRATSIQSGV